MNQDSHYYLKVQFSTKFRAKCAMKKYLRMSFAVRRGSAVLVLSTPITTNKIADVMTYYKGHPNSPTQDDINYARHIRSDSTWND